MVESFMGHRPNPNISSKSRGRLRAKGPQGDKRGKNARPESQGELVILRPMFKTRDVRRKFSASADISSSGAGAIALTANGAADIISTLGSEWTNFAQEYSQFRVRSVGIHFFPSTTSATSSTGPYQAGVVGCCWCGLKSPSASAIQQANELVKWSTLEEKELLIVNPTENTKLWNPVGTALPIDRDFGFAFVGVGTVAISSRIFTVTYVLDTEFRVPQ